MAPSKENGTLSGSGGKKTFAIQAGKTTTITDFGGVGTGVNPAADVLAEVDTLKFNKGNGLEARFLRLTQQGDDLLITFELDDTQVILKDFDLEDLENLSKSTGASVDIGNIIFDGQTKIKDGFDVINANQTLSKVFNPNTVTFLNDLDNETRGRNNSDDVIHGQDGNDLLRGGTGNDDLYGGEGNDFLDGEQGSDFVYGGDGDDTMYATETDDYDYLNGEAGNDSLYGGAGNSSLNGGAGNDLLSSGSGNNGLDGGAGNDELNGGAGNNTLSGGAGDDILNGGDGDDSLGDGQGNNILDGGDGFDFVNGAGTVDLTAGTVSGSQGNDVLSNIEGIRGSGTLIGNEEDNVIQGSGENDILYGGTGNDTLSVDWKGTLYGGSGNDNLQGSYDDENGRNVNDTLYGEAGNDRLEGRQGNDTLYGGSGSDYLLGDNTTGTEYGNDILNGGNGNDNLDGGDGNDILNGGTGDDRFFESSSFRGLENDDTLNGGNGFDFVEYSVDGGVTIDLAAGTASGGAGNDVLSNIEGVRGSDDNDTLIGNEKNNILDGGFGGKDTLNGGEGEDTLTGGSNNDKLSGGSGNDILAGGFGATGEIDILSGGAGEDRFVFGDLAGDFYEDRDPAAMGKKDYALIKDFNAEEDVIQLSGDKTDYVLKPSPSGVPVGTGLFLSNSESEPDELISIIQGDAGPLSLDSNAFNFNSPSSVFNLANLNGTNGFVFQGINETGFIGGSVSNAGDVNGDGFDDLIIGANGASYVVFGKAEGFEASLNPNDLDGSNGFVIKDLDGYGYGASFVSNGGDINGDGLDDLIIKENRGASYVVFGKAEGFEASLNPNDLNGSNGFVIDGGGNSANNAGDVNGDGFDDFLIGNQRYSSSSSSSYISEVYVVFGKAGDFEASFNPADLDGSDGFVIQGDFGGPYSFISGSSAGDINGDDLDDLIIGSNYDTSYVVFGRAEGFSANLDFADLDGNNGFAFQGIDENDFVNSAGDINGDGLNDLTIGSYDDTSYVVFGKAGGFDASLNPDDLDGSNGFVINDVDRSGSKAGDINGDGFDDLLIWDFGTRPSYVLFGKAGGFNASLNPDDLDGTDGFVINGSVNSVSTAGDINADGFDDLIIGDSNADPNGQYLAGESYVVFGQDFTGQVNRPGTSGDDTLTGTSGADILIGGLGNDILLGQGGSDVLKGGGGNDILGFDPADRRIEGDAGTDTLQIDGSGVTLDLTTIANNKITGIEAIDLTGTGNNSLTFSRLDLLDLSDTTNQLIVQGNTGDAVSSTGQGWTLDGTATLDDTLYNRYTVGTATLLVGTTLSQTLS